MALPALAGLLSAARAIPGVGSAGMNLIGGAVQGAVSGTVPLDKAFAKINTALGPVSQAFDKTASQASQLYGTFYKLKNGFDTAVGIVKGVGGLIGKVVGTVASAVKKVVTTAVHTAVTAVGFVLSGDVIAKPIKMVAGAIGTLNAPALNVVGSLTKLRDAMTAVGESVAPFVQMANPAIAQRWRFVADDLTASFGRLLIPALKAATVVTRGFADVTFALSGPLQKLGNAFEPLVSLVPRITNALSPVMDVVRTVLNELADVIKPFNELGASAMGELIDTVAGGFKLLWITMKPGVEITAMLAASTAKLIAALSSNTLGNLFNGLGALARTGPSINGGSAGAAVRNVGFTGFEQQHNKLITQAFSLGTASAEDRMASDLTSIRNWLQNDLPARLKDAALSMPGRIASEFVQFVEQVAQELKKSILDGSPAKAIGEAGVSAGRYLDRLRPGGGSDGLLASYVQNMGQ